MKRLCAIFLLSVLLPLLSFSETKIIAHRGFSSAAPENTLTAFRKAIAAGADYFELDVHQSRDGRLVVIHDGTVNRVASEGATGTVADMNYPELRKVRVGYSQRFEDKFSRERIPTLRRALRTAKGKIGVCVEIKVEGIEDATLKTIRRLKMGDEVIIFSFHYSVLEKFRELDADIPLLYLRSVVDSTVIANASAIGASAIGAGRATQITPALLKKVRENGMELWQWTVNDPADMEHLLKLGIDGIITDYPDKALELRAWQDEQNSFFDPGS
jgi:glycerophosphoryl diester phosphodiesterase